MALIEDFETLTGWSPSGDGSQSLDEVNVKSGVAASKLISTGYFQSSKLISADLSGNIDIAFWLHIENVSDLYSIRLLLSTHATWWENYFSKIILGTALVTGWNYIRLAKADFTTTGTLSWDNTSTAIIIDNSAIVGHSAEVTYDSLQTITKNHNAIKKAMILNII